jgi:hypothetical protein
MRRIVSTCFVALGFVVAVSAQDRPTSPPAAPGGLSAPQTPDTQRPSTPTPRPEGTAGQTDTKSIMVVGCIAGGPTNFTLTNAMAAGSTDKPATGAVGTAGSAGIASSYDLTPRAGVELKPHVGHKVEITGTPEMASSTTTAPTTGAAGTKPAPKLTVTNVKMMSASCP